MAEIRTPGNKVWINEQGATNQPLEELPVVEEEQGMEEPPLKSNSPKEPKASSKSGKKGLKPLKEEVFDDQDELDEEEDKMDSESSLPEADSREM